MLLPFALPTLWLRSVESGRQAQRKIEIGRFQMLDYCNALHEAREAHHLPFIAIGLYYSQCFFLREGLSQKQQCDFKSLILFGRWFPNDRYTIVRLLSDYCLTIV